jgi:GR25 family glycosyltransferase involved in LPS biosynthesis
MKNTEGDNKEKIYLDGVDIIYWINLDRAKDRKKKMENLFKDPVFEGIKNVRFSAFDKKKENPRTKFILKEDDNLVSDNKNRTDSEYAILFSHLEVIRKFSKTDYENALIFEDDISMEYKKYWTKTIQEVIDNAPKDWEIIKLFGFSGKEPNKLYTLWEPFINNVPVNKRKDAYKWESKRLTGDFGAMAYLISNRAAKKLIKQLYRNNKYVLDNDCMHVSDVLIYQKLKTYVYKYPFFTYNDNNYSYNLGLSKKNLTHLYKKNVTTNMYKKMFSRKNKTRKNKTSKTNKN